MVSIDVSRYTITDNVLISNTVVVICRNVEYSDGNITEFEKAWTSEIFLELLFISTASRSAECTQMHTHGFLYAIGIV